MPPSTRTLGAALTLVLATGCAHTPPSTPDSTEERPMDPQEIADWAVAHTLELKPDASPLTKPPPIAFERDHTLAEATAQNPAGLRVLHYRLANGLQVVMLEDHSAPVFAYQTWFAVGSRDERPGITGIAHLFEHLMFKETRNLGPGEFDTIMEAHGAETNAATWLDWTMYREELPAGNLPLVVRLEADRMENMVLGPEQLESEREVVKNERRYRVDNDPEGAMFEALYALAYTRHPYHWPTIGWMKDLDAITLKDCLDFYATFYAPNNAAVVIAGDFAPERALALINSHYGHLKAAEIARNPIDAEPAQERERRRLLTMPLSSPKLLYGYHTPAMKDDALAAVQVLNQIVLEGRSSRLHRRLVIDDETVAEVSGWVGEFADPGLYEVLLTLKPGASAEAVEEALDAELERMQTELVSPRELAKAQNQLEAETLRNMQSMGDRAYGIGHTLTTVGDWAPLFDFTERIRAVTAEDVRDAARTWLKRDNRSVIIAMPRPGEPEDAP